MTTSHAAEEASTSESHYVDHENPIIGLHNCKLIQQGAEARVWEGVYLGKPAVLKQRFSKRYRHPSLDARLTQTRLKQEVRSMLRARKLGVLTPCVLCVEHEASTIYFERVEGVSVKQALSSGALQPAAQLELLRAIGSAIAALHDGGVIHGDLTTSNLLVRAADNALVVIDFGLSSNSSIAEDKAVDLYVLERAFTSAHASCGPLFEDVLASYRQHSRLWCPTLNKFAEVRMRGRKRAMVG
ncbi:hypothetical protein WJX81_002223 [Elliptochloris bilobata]|uniref:non-specific serine/threonine protein kinase n=1 Tax=Elliptochloris bilobata TaxID=381761 RepID=A0AAW1S5J7_9CHLO